MAESNKGEVVVNTALALFSAHGYHAVGVDTIKAQAGVAKMTMYKHFPTKDILIERVLQRRDANFRADLSAAVASAACEPRARLKAVFDWHRSWFSQPAFNGCMFIKAVEEFPDMASQARVVSRQHKDWVRELLLGLLRELGVKAPEALATCLLVVLDGLIVNANLYRDLAVVDSTWIFVERLVDKSL